MIGGPMTDSLQDIEQLEHVLISQEYIDLDIQEYEATLILNELDLELRQELWMAERDHKCSS